MAASAETLRGDSRDAILREIKHIDRPWHLMSEQQQESAISRCNDLAQNLVDEALRIIAHRGAPHFVASVAKWGGKGAELEFTIKAPAIEENVIAFIKHHGPVVMVLIDPALYLGERAPATADVVGELRMPKDVPGDPLNKFLGNLKKNGPPAPERDAGE